MTSKRFPTPLRPRPGKAIALLAILACIASAGAQVPSESELKAAFVYNFAKFVQWPAEAFASATAPLHLCVAGRDLPPAFEALHGKSAQGREVRVRRLLRTDDVGQCHALYVPESAESLVPEHLRNSRGTPILTIGESEGFAANRGIVGFAPRDDRLHFEINPESAARAGIRVSSQLLRLSTIVRDEKRVRP